MLLEESEGRRESSLVKAIEDDEEGGWDERMKARPTEEMSSREVLGEGAKKGVGGGKEGVSSRQVQPQEGSFLAVF